MTTIGIIQPNFLPWRGYFDFIAEVDAFVFHDDVQYTKGDWRNRNRVRTLSGETVWLTVPVRAPGLQRIDEVVTDESTDWRGRHLRMLQRTYRRAPHFESVMALLEAEYARRETNLAQLDIALTRQVLDWLGITTKLYRGSELNVEGDRNHKLIRMVRQLGGTRYLSGRAAEAYLQPELWAAGGVELAFKSYEGYPDYPQISAPFDPQVSILDLLFMTGPDACQYLQRRSVEGATA